MQRNGISSIIHKIGRKYRLEYLSYGLHPHSIYNDGKRAISELLKQHDDVDILLASFVRPIAMRLASWAHKEYGIPWVADFRDTLEMIDFKWKERIMFKTERRVISSASFIVTTSPSLIKQLKTRHKQPIHVINNGYDPEGYENLTPVKWDRFTIVYTGSLLPGRSPLLFYHALDDLLSDGFIPSDDIQVVHYGVTNFRVDHQFLTQLLRKVKHRTVLVFRERIAHRQAIEAQVGADLLLLLPGLVSRHGGNIPAKLFEYLRSGRPILSVATSPQDEVAEIIDQCNAGLATSDLDQIKEYVLSQYQAWKQNNRTPVVNESVDLEPYSRQYQTRQLKDLMLEVLTDQQSSDVS